MANNRNDPINLLNLPGDILGTAIPAQVSERNATTIMGQLSNTCSALYNFFQPELNKQAVKQLLTYVLQGNAAKAKMMYTVNPGLLFMKSIAEEYAAGVDEDGKAVHRMVAGSPYQAALGAGDIWMLEEMAPYFDQVIDIETGKNGSDLAKEQLAQQFPNGFDYPPSTYDFSNIVTAITNDEALIQTGKPSIATETILAQFRKDFMPGLVISGYHFNLNELITACGMCCQNQLSWNGKQENLFWRQIVGFLERLVSAVDAQVISESIIKIAEEKQPLNRSFVIYNFNTVINYNFNSMFKEEFIYFPLDHYSNFRLGVNFGANYIGRRRSTISNPFPVLSGSNFKELRQAKIKKLEVFQQRLQQSNNYSL